MTNLEQAKANEKERIKTLHEEPFQVNLQLEGWPHIVRITYAKEKSDRILQLEELNAAEAIETSCTFKGRSSSGTGCDYLKVLKQAIQGMKPKDWYLNPQYIDSHYKQYKK